jgi:hypothetical protein
MKLSIATKFTQSHDINLDGNVVKLCTFNEALNMETPKWPKIPSVEGIMLFWGKKYTKGKAPPHILEKC